MEQLTHEQAIAFSNSGIYEDMTDRQIAEFQIEQDFLCMPFSVFHKAMEQTLGRPVYTHEFGFVEHLKKELYGEKAPASIDEIINLIPEEKRIIIGL